MSGRSSRLKGANFERKIANILKPIFDTKRGVLQTRQGNEVADVEGSPYWIECKRHKKSNIKAAMRQAEADTDGRPPLVITKDDHQPILVTMKLDDWINLVTCLSTNGTTGTSTE